MTAKKICTVLDQHSIPYYIKSGRIYADSMESGTELFGEVVDVTDWTARALLDWLGY